MKEKPIIFSEDSVWAILAGKKTQTRRVIKPQPPVAVDVWRGPDGAWWYHPPGRTVAATSLRCPYRAGDLIWVRETWGFSPTLPVSAHDEPAWLAYPHLRGYKADNPEGNWCWRSPIFMPRWASRLTLRVTGVRVERVQDIHPLDVEAEGVEVSCYYCEEPTADRGGVHRCDPIGKFAALWDTLNAKRGYSWASNPFVWVISFEVCRAPTA
jgi:hypothetical protein